MIQIIIDSTADMSPETAREFGIEVVPQYVHLGDKTYLDGIDLRPDQLFELVARTGQLPKTAAAPVEAFRKAFDTSGPVVFISLSSRLSALIQSAHLAAQEFPEGQVFIVDSLNASSGIALLAMLAADLRDQGLPPEAIAACLEERRTHVRTTFIVETMEYIYKGGRCTALQAVAGSLLKIHPIIEVRRDGTVGLKGKIRGSRRKCLQILLDDFATQLPELDRKRVFVTHTGCDEDAEFLRSGITHLADPEKVYVTLAGSVISSHCGPGTIGILHMVK